MNTKQSKFTIKDFNKQFPNDNTCLEWLKNYRYPEGIFCKSCNKITTHSKLSNLPVYSCNLCGSHTHPMVGTIFENSRTPLRYWFYAMFLMSATRCGISAKQLQRELGVTYKTAWRMFHQIRSLLGDDDTQLSGEVELDETYFGARRPGKRGRGAGNKTAVFGIMQRRGNVKARTTDDLKSSTIYPIVKQNITINSTLYTDEFPMYNKIKILGYKHETVNHESKVYVIGNAHTNTIEGFWSLLKRGIDGVYHAVSPKHLQKYVNEYAFRYNHRKDERAMFLTFLEQI